jgi:hypothetical protein
MLKVKIHLDKLPLTDGKIHFIRKVDNEGRINVLNETFKVGKEFIGEYVWATICLAKRKMKVYYRAKDQDAAMITKYSKSFCMFHTPTGNEERAFRDILPSF